MKTLRDVENLQFAHFSHYHATLGAAHYEAGFCTEEKAVKRQEPNQPK